MMVNKTFYFLSVIYLGGEDSNLNTTNFVFEGNYYNKVFGTAMSHKYRQ
jgi:hypothetical protein